MMHIVSQGSCKRGVGGWASDGECHSVNNAYCAVPKKLHSTHTVPHKQTPATPKVRDRHWH
eukprot:3399211-Amphidinium_carterae.1